ncbi:hypothetical protein EPO05_02640 [Patescibacteria group bacterium]|nr:MAG: hypothetical protein EPO05_02640 [Patescibacteria group bacterium]
MTGPSVAWKEPITEDDLDTSKKFRKPSEGAVGVLDPERALDEEKGLEREASAAETPEPKKDPLAKIKQVATEQGTKLDQKDLAAAPTLATPEDRVRYIVEMAKTPGKGPVAAVKMAMHLSENYPLDKVHDGLVDKDTHEEMVRLGLLEEF